MRRIETGIYRVDEIWFDDGAFGYYADSITRTVAVFVDRATAKAIRRHFRNLDGIYRGGPWRLIIVEQIIYTLEGVRYSDESMNWEYKESQFYNDIPF